MKWSLAMIARNNEETIGQTLESVKSFIDEIIVVDTGSTDNTISVAEAHGATVGHFEWIDDFASARNYSFSLATGDWIMWLDTGDVIPEDAQKAFLALKHSPKLNSPDSDIEMVWTPLNRGIDENGVVVHNFLTSRVVRRSANPLWESPIHEYLVTDNLVAYADEKAYVNDPLGFGQVATDRNIKILSRLIAEGDRSARTLFYYANELRDLKRYDESIEAFNDFLTIGDYSWFYYHALLSISQCHRELGNVNGTAEPLLQAIYFDPTRAEAWVWLAEGLYSAGEWARAIPFYRASVGLSEPRDGSFTNSTCYGFSPLSRLGYCYTMIGDEKAGLEYFRAALKVAPPHLKDHLKQVIHEVKTGEWKLNDDLKEV